MTIHQAIFSPWRQILLSVLFLLLTGQMTLIVAAFQDGRSRRTKGVLLVPFLLCTTVFWLCMAMIAWEHNFHSRFEGLPGWLAAVGALPAWSLALFEVPMAVFLVLAFRDMFSYGKDHLTPDSVKQAMDHLPVGVAFAGMDGDVMFRNLVMDHLSQALTGKLLTDLGAFRAAAEGDRLSVENRVWQLSASTLSSGQLTQLTATDITEQAGILAGLEANHKKLKDIRLRLEIYNRQAERIIIAQELLTARMAVHDQLGSVLLESRHYMTDPSSIDEELLLQALKNANTYLLREYEKDDTAMDPLTEAVDMARAIGVQVELTGVPPAEEKPRAVFAAAIRECATNAVKHADGDCVQVDARRTGTGYTFTLCSNGMSPAEPIRETGGLLSLRTLVEKCRGVMRVKASPAFCVIIELPPYDSSIESRENPA